MASLIMLATTYQHSYVYLHMYSKELQKYVVTLYWNTIWQMRLWQFKLSFEVSKVTFTALQQPKNKGKSNPRN